MLPRLLPVVLAALLGACTTTPAPTVPVPTPKPTAPSEPVTARYQPAQWPDLPGWPGDLLLDSWPAWLKSCSKLGARPDWKPACDEARTLIPLNARIVQDYFERQFQPWRIETSTGEDTGLITGYYEALLNGGASYRTGRVPLYGLPDDLLTLDLVSVYPELKGQRVRGRLDGKTVLPYWSRRDIDAGRLGAHAQVLAWADDPVDAFFLQVQGSGRIQMDDGSMLRLAYADQNGHPYRSIGKWLVDQGEMTLDQASMQSIRAWAQLHPDRLPELMAANPSYVFFKVLPNSNDGALGALNVPLTDGASIAVDRRFIPLGSPVYLASTRPDTQGPLQRLVHAQDTGGAIRGPVRADYFWGFGHAAAELAGKTKQRGRLWLLWPKGVALPPGQ